MQALEEWMAIRRKRMLVEALGYIPRERSLFHEIMDEFDLGTPGSGKALTEDIQELCEKEFAAYKAFCEERRAGCSSS